MADNVTHAQIPASNIGVIEESVSSRGAETVPQSVAMPISQRLPEISRHANLNMGSLSPGEIQMLQRTIGNQAVMRRVAGHQK
jgi:hypothetical protein